jgi:hypothetical protein
LVLGTKLNLQQAPKLKAQSIDLKISRTRYGNVLGAGIPEDESKDGGYTVGKQPQTSKLF